MNELETKVDEQEIEAIVESHRDNPDYDEIYLADLDWLAMNADCDAVTLIEEIGCEWVVGIKYPTNEDAPTS